jgi:hypothetical protein
MKGFILKNKRGKGYRNFLSVSINVYLLNPIISGLYRFALFFTILLFVKIIMLLINGQEALLVEIEKVKMSFIGFFSFYGLSIIQRIFEER